jgi:hypothetical protein
MQGMWSAGKTKLVIRCRNTINQESKGVKPMTKTQKRELQYKIKVEKSLALLPKMQEPISRGELERRDKVNPHAYQSLFAYLDAEKLIVRAGDNGHRKLWQAATKFVKPPVPSLADAHFVYDASHYQKQHSETARLARLERRSPRVYVSGAQTYA